LEESEEGRSEQKEEVARTKKNGENDTSIKGYMTE
jgi:hypothetical protein